MARNSLGAQAVFTLDRKSEAVDIIRLPRHSDLAVEGWRGGDPARSREARRVRSVVSGGRPRYVSGRA